MDSFDPLEPNEARILGVLIEKELTVPDQYPLSLNATTAGCNQKSNRNPVLQLSETEVQMQLDKLVVAGFVGRVHPATSRVERFRHNFCERLDVDPTKAAILAELMMRGPQSRGDLRTRANRMSPIPTLEELAANLEPLIQRGLVRRLPPAPGSRAERFVQCLAPDSHPLDAAPVTAPDAAPVTAPVATEVAAAAPEPVAPTPERSSELEQRVARLERQLADLAEKLGEPLSDS